MNKKNTQYYKIKDIKKIASEIYSNYVTNYGTIIISEKEISRLIRKYNMTKLVSAISYLIKTEKLIFPYKKFFIKDVEQKFLNLKNYSYKLQLDSEYFISVLVEKTNALKPYHYKGKYTIIPSKKSEYDDINILSDYFQENARIVSVAGFGNLSSFEFWKAPKQHYLVLRNLIQQKKEISSYTLREEIYRISRGEPPTFKITVAKAIIQILKGTNVLDFSSGWGDRLLAAIACEDQIERYVGVDPNEDLFPGYQNMINKFATDPNRFKMVCMPFEKYNLENEGFFDLVFTGPPYFNYEKYGNNAVNQSIHQFPIFEDWLVKFLFFSIAKAWKVLKTGGKMALNISDVRSLITQNIFYTEAANLFIRYKLTDAIYKGVICFTGANKPIPRPIWIYKKGKIDTKSSKKAGKLLEKHYPKIYEMINENF